MVFCSAGFDTLRNHFQFEYLSEFEMKIKNILGHESGAHMGLIYEKTRGKKSGLRSRSWPEPELAGAETFGQSRYTKFRLRLPAPGQTKVVYLIIIHIKWDQKIELSRYFFQKS
jgi:hypothetical protein